MQEGQELPHIKKKALSNEALDGIAAVLLIAILVAGLFYWLEAMP